MEKRTLGRTGIEVTVLGHGAMEIRGPRFWGGRPVTDDEAARILNAVLDSGINFIDTAWDYGLAEEYIGKSISHRRDEFVLATKCGCHWVDRGDHYDVEHIWTPDQLRHNLETSLQRMKTDYVDIWQLHNPSPDEAAEHNVIDFMEKAKQDGKVRHVAISSTWPDISTYLQWDRFDTYQIPYSALERQQEDAIAAVGRAGCGVIVRGGVARGEPGTGSGQQNQWDVWEQAKLDELLEAGESRTAFLLRFTISHPQMHTTIVGTKNPEHLAENVKAAEAGPLSARVYQEAKDRLVAAGQAPDAA